MSVARRWLDVTLALLFIVSLAAVLLAHDSDFLRKPFCAAVSVCPSLDHADASNKVAYDLGIGGLTSLMFYGLLVRLPDWRRRRRIRRSLSGRYLAFKKDMISTMLGVAEGTYDYDLVEKLVDLKQFKDYFKEGVGRDHERWHRFLNNLDEHNIRDMLMAMEIFRADITHVMLTTDIEDVEASEFFKRLSALLYSHKDTTPEYDPVKQLSQFLWNVFAGWDWVSGYRERDIVQDMIDSI